MWVPGKTSSLCSKYFAPDDFQRPLKTEVNLKRDLEKDEIGVCVYKKTKIWSHNDLATPSSFHFGIFKYGTLNFFCVGRLLLLTLYLN